MSVTMADGIVASDAELARRERVRRGRRRVAWLLASAIGILIAMAGLSPWFRITVSFTHSLPQRVFLIRVGRMPSRGDLVAFHPPPNRFYPDRGGFIKRVRGVAGDRVSREGRSYRINGVPIGEAKTTSLDGRTLDAGPVGVIPQGHYFVWTSEPDSFDSRYADIGWIGQDRIVGVAAAVY